jgi:hypothetical protein
MNPAELSGSRKYGKYVMRACQLLQDVTSEPTLNGASVVHTLLKYARRHIGPPHDNVS